MLVTTVYELSISVQSVAEATLMLQESKRALTKPRLWPRLVSSGLALQIRAHSPMNRRVIWTIKLPPFYCKSAGALGWLDNGSNIGMA